MSSKSTALLCSKSGSQQTAEPSVTKLGMIIDVSESAMRVKMVCYVSKAKVTILKRKKEKRKNRLFISVEDGIYALGKAHKNAPHPVSPDFWTACFCLVFCWLLLIIVAYMNSSDILLLYLLVVCL